MAKIASIHALEVLDSRGNPTVQVSLTTDSGIVGKAKVPSGASTGEHEALELRDQDPKRYFGKGVTKAVENVNGPLQELLVGELVFEQEKLDKVMIEADGTPNKSKFGANAILGVSLAIARAGAYEKRAPLYRYLGGDGATLIPCPMMNILNGGMHSDNLLDFQEFMIHPIGASTFKEALRWGSEVFHTLKGILKEKGFSTGVGDEGGFAPMIHTNEEVLDLIVKAIEKAGYKPKDDITIALDPAASEFFDKKTNTYVEFKKKNTKQKFATSTSDEQVEYLKKLTKKYPIDSIEDGLAENDWDGWQKLTKELGNQIQLVGDDIFVTNTKFIKKGIEKGVGNSVLIKLNQIGTLTESFEAIELAKKNNYKTVVSHRSAETEDPFIADFTVASQAGQIKSGSLCRSERLSKYNRLLEIEEELGEKANYYSS